VNSHTRLLNPTDRLNLLRSKFPACFLAGSGVFLELCSSCNNLCTPQKSKSTTDATLCLECRRQALLLHPGTLAAAPIPALVPTAPTAPTLPTLSELHFGDFNPTSEYIPAGIRHRVARSLIRAIDAVVVTGSIEAWRDCFLLGHVLAVNTSRRKFEEVILGRLDQFDGKVFVPSHDSSTNTRTTNAKARASRLAEVGLLSKAARTLQSLPLAPANDATHTALLAKHPTPPQPTTLPPPLPPSRVDPVIKATEDQVRSAITSFPMRSADGWSGWRPSHIQALIKGSEGPAVLTAITALVNLIIHGSIHPDVVPHLAGARLVALTKDEIDVRPIAVGETFRRLAAKVALAMNKNAIDKFFQEDATQLGLSRSGAERILHAVHTLRAQPVPAGTHPPTLIRVDLMNAFNVVDRSHILRQVQLHFPTLYNISRLCLGSISALSYNGHRIDSAGGVQQGDPLGPLLFCLGLQTLTSIIASRLGSSLLLSKFYLDDGVVIIRPDPASSQPITAENVLQLIEDEGAPYGLILNRSKSICVPITDNFKLLGSPVGNSTFVSAFVTRKIEKALALLAKVVDLPDHNTGLPDPHRNFTIMRFCAGFSKVGYLLRTIPASDALEPFSQFDLAVLTALEKLIGRPSLRTELDIAQLSIGDGGLGLRSVVTHSPAAILSAISTAAALDGWDARSHPAWISSVSDFNDHVAATDRLDATAPTAALSQATLSTKIDTERATSILSSLPTHLRTILRSTRTQHASDWLLVVPTTSNGFHLPPVIFRAAVQFRQGRVTEAEHCLDCGATRVDNTGYHTTAAAGHTKYTTHQALAREFAAFAREAGLAPIPERKFPQSTLRPADVYIPCLSLGKAFAFDFAVTHPLQPKFLKISSELDGGAAATAYAKEEKLAKSEYIQLCAANGCMYIPLVVDTYGAWASECHEFFNGIARVHSVVRQIHPASSLKLLMTSLSVCLIRRHAVDIIRNRPFVDE
jgi:hypothetical protein